MCYDVRQAAGQSKPPRVTGIFVNNDFGPQQLDMKGGQEALPRRETRQQLCLPSRQTDLTP
jgi:hypothetical protein